MTLHILSASPFGSECLADCRRVITAGDALLLSSDGVYAVLGAHAAELQELHAAGVALFALSEDCQARGVDSRMPACVRSVNYGDFVELAVAHARSVSWF